MSFTLWQTRYGWHAHIIPDGHEEAVCGTTRNLPRPARPEILGLRWMLCHACASRATHHPALGLTLCAECDGHGYHKTWAHGGWCAEWCRGCDGTGLTAMDGSNVFRLLAEHARLIEAQ